MPRNSFSKDSSNSCGKVGFQKSSFFWTGQELLRRGFLRSTFSIDSSWSGEAMGCWETVFQRIRKKVVTHWGSEKKIFKILGLELRRIVILKINCSKVQASFVTHGALRNSVSQDPGNSCNAVEFWGTVFQKNQGIIVTRLDSEKRVFQRFGQKLCRSGMLRSSFSKKFG